ncbi:MAG: hypothetical protein ISS65_09690 [Desulfobacterales bacterium]|nr:hypothetical protein [Desulfobacterales bacterium]
MKKEALFITLSLIVAGIGAYVLLTGHWATNIGDVGEKLKCLCDQEKFCQSFTNVPQTLKLNNPSSPVRTFLESSTEIGGVHLTPPFLDA